jgi:hypothetical protein
MEDLDVDDLKQEAICSACVGESFLSRQIKSEGEKRICRYCRKKAVSFTLEKIAGIFEVAFLSHFSATATDPDAIEWAMQKDPQIGYSWERKGEPTVRAIMNAANIDEEAAHDIQRILADEHGDIGFDGIGEETPFSDEAHYEEIMPSDDEWRESWRNFERSLKSEARFFSRNAVAQLAALFDDVDSMRTRSGRPLIVPAGPGTSLDHLFRARVFQSDEKLKKALNRPDRELAAPPSAVAATGRMNAKGISTFYGATDMDIALAEVRPPVGSQVAIARFDIIRPLQLLDLNALSDIHETGSIFDPSYAQRLGRMMFLRSFCQRVSKPVMPDDQDFEYLPTQAIADYLATEGKVPLDGILFPSVQAGGDGFNIVLFHKASGCEELNFPKGTEIEASTATQYAEGWAREYTVFEHVPLENPEEKGAASHPFDFSLFEPIDWDELQTKDFRDPALRIVLDSLEVHVVQSVRFETTAFPVRRHRWNKNDGDF